MCVPDCATQAQPNLGLLCDREGSIVKLGRKARYRNAVVQVQFLGRTHFGAGVWAGVQVIGARRPRDGHELTEEERRHSQQIVKLLGKHDGKYEGVRYFTASPRSALFVRPRALTIIYD